MGNGAAVVGSSLTASRKVTRTELPQDPAIPLQGVCPEELKTGTETNTHLCIYDRQKVEAAKRSAADEWVHQARSVHTAGRYSAVEMKETQGGTPKTSCSLEQARCKRPHII